jgi:protein-disulfide isomerase
VKPSLIEEFVEPGLVRLEYRDYAFRGPEALRAAEAAACAEDQGAFWQYHETLFLNQRSPEGFSDARLKQIAETLGLDTAAFNQCLDSGEKRAGIEQEIAEGQAQGVDSTPTVFVNGVEAEWAPWETLRPAIEAALAGADTSDTETGDATPAS